jgi:hypothetical protein
MARVILALALCAALSTSLALAADPARRVAVVPIACLGGSDAACEQMRTELTQSLEARFDIELAARADIDAAVQKRCGHPEEWWNCLEQDPNLFALGGALSARYVVAGRLASAGDNQVLRLRIADTTLRTVSTETLELSRGQAQPVLTRFFTLHDRMFPQRAGSAALGAGPAAPAAPQGAPQRAGFAVEPAQPWYARWQTWTIGAAIAAGVVGAVLIGLQVTAPASPSGFDVRLGLP